jgi:addiction module HigA family antidote
MPMKTPPHPGLGLRDDIEALELSVTAAAVGLGVSRQQLNNILSGRNAITPEMAVRLEKAIGSTADHWLRLQTNYDLAEVRRRETELHVTSLRPKVA